MSSSFWGKHRLHQSSNQCACKHCGTSSNICSICQDWNVINWETPNSPLLTCSHCKRSFHINCLPPRLRRPNSWNICSDIDANLQCSSYLDLFSFLNKHYAQKHESLIHDLWRDIFPNRLLQISAHFESFEYNAFKYVVQDCVQILLNGEHAANGRINDIFCTKQNEAFVLIQWYVQSINNKSELMFDGDLKNADLIRVENINQRIKIMDSMKEYEFECIRLKEAKEAKIKNVNELKRNYDEKTFESLCLFQNIESNENINYDNVYWCSLTTQNDKIAVADTNKSRMRLQREILIQNEAKRNGRNENGLCNSSEDIKCDETDFAYYPKLKRRKIDYDGNENYGDLQKENEKLKKEIDRLKKEKCRNEQCENEMSSLRRLKNMAENKLMQQEKNYKEEMGKHYELKAKNAKLLDEGKRKRAQLREKLKNMEKEKNERIASLEREVQSLKAKVKNKNKRIDFLQKAKDHNDNTVHMVPFSVVPKEARMPSLDNPNDIDSSNHNHNQQQLRQQEMNRDELMNMFTK